MAGKPSTVLNLGTGQGHSVLELAKAVENVSGRSVPQKFAPRRVGDPPSLVASADKAKRELGWHPQHSDLETILRTAWTWFQAEAKRTETPN